MGKFIDLTGVRVGLLTVIERVPSVNKHTLWKCLCDCGKFHNVETRHIRGSKIKSCGCSSNKFRSINNPSATHRMSSTGTYKSWIMMKSRCDNPNYDLYGYYGGRGISYCPSWSNFENFLVDMGERPANLTLDRIDSNGNYTKSNCRWATRETQVDNRSNARFFEFKGISLSLKDWGKLVNESRERLYQFHYKNPELTLEDIFLKIGKLSVANAKISSLHKS